jgi:3-hydroxybutyrate dehydrogenase
MKLAGKVAIVTGAASGLGRAIAEKYLAEGARVAIADVRGADEAARALGPAALGVSMDVTDEKQVDAGVGRVAKELGGVDVLVSNAGVQHISALVDLKFSDWRRMLAIHLDGAFLTTRACLRQMASQKRGGAIIYMGSVHSKEASPLKGPYVTAKHGLIGLCKSVAKEGAAFGVRSNVICPGFVRTPLVEKQIPEQARELGITEEEVIKNVMLRATVDGEFTTLADVAEVALFFAAFPSNALTGQSVIVSHGWHME